MKRLLLGVIIGLFLSSYLYFFVDLGPRFRIEIGQMLDKDTLYLKDGSVIDGWIIRNDKRTIWFAQEKGYFTLPVSQCELIRENVLLQYIWELI